MEFKKTPPLNLRICDTCQQDDFGVVKKCKECAGMKVGFSIRGMWLYWDYSLTRYNLALQRGRRILNRIRLVTVFVLWLNAWIWAGFLLYAQGDYALLLQPKQWSVFTIENKWILFLFWFGVLALLYLWYRLIRQKQIGGSVERTNYNRTQTAMPVHLSVDSWAQAVALPKKKKRNISNAFTDEALSVLAKTYYVADKNRAKVVTPEHLFYTVLSFNRISNIFIRLGVSVDVLRKQLEQFLQVHKKQTAYTGVAPQISPDLYQIIFQAYEEAYVARQEYVGVTELLMIALRQNPALQEILFNFDITERQLANVIAWARMREKMYRDYVKLQKAASHHSKYGMDKAMTALATPYLNSFSTDVTMLAHYGQLEACVARTADIDEIFQIIEGGQSNLLLVGEHGVGRKTIIEGIAQSMIEDEVPEKLKDKRLVRLSVSALLAGASPEGAIDRLRRIMEEMARARNVILYINNIHELIGVAVGQSGSLDIADTLAEFLSNKRFLVIATTTPEDYAQHILGTSVKDVFAKVDIREMDEDQAIAVLESRAGALEYKHNIFFSYAAISACVEYSLKFFHESCLPGSALEIMTEAAAFTKNKKGVNTIVTKEEVAMVVTEKTKIPLSAISSNESDKLLRLEEEMHMRVIGQNEGVSAVANALRRARAEMRSTKRPIASFLFLGPTGVGKTELAKTIADVYFGGEQMMIRLDMSEYQDKSSIYRLIGLPGSKGTGILTEAVRQHPFSLVLLDEIEKADPDVLNVFLQVMDDGRLTDSSGYVFDFTNVIIIATSNAGTLFVQEQSRTGMSHEELLNQLLHTELRQYFRPEFLNRFDSVVLFNSLQRSDIKKIAGLMFAGIAKEIEKKGVVLVATDEALDFLANAGFDPEFGARPMRRALQERVENKLAELFLQGKLKRGSTVTIGADGAMVVA
jgi:ATP-dependent Clp protease ATP-binding subunit ClpC